MSNFRKFTRLFAKQSASVSGVTLGWVAIAFLHSAFIPSLVAVMTGISDNMPSLDVVLFIWAGLLILFARAVIMKDTPSLIINSIGFIVQAFMLALVVFR